MNFSTFLKHTCLISSATLILSACGTTSPVVGSDSGVSYGDPKAVETVNTDLGSTDIQMITEKMVQSLIQTPLLKNIIKKRQTVTGSPIQNKTSEYFDTKTISDSILMQMQKNGVRYVLESEDMQNQVDELRRQNQSGLYNSAKTAKVGKMEGAKYRLDGSISSIVKRNSNVKDVYYKVNMRLIEIETGVVEWVDEKEIRKVQKR